MTIPRELLDEIREGFAFFGFHDVASMTDEELAEAAERLPELAPQLGVSVEEMQGVIRFLGQADEDLRRVWVKS